MKKIAFLLVMFFAFWGNVSASEDKGAVHKAPKTYIASVKRLKSIHHELNELTKKHQLYKFHEPLELFDAILAVLPGKAEDDIYNAMRANIDSIESGLMTTAERIDHAADEGELKVFARHVKELNKYIGKLNVYLELSNERKIGLGHNVPKTYKRMLHRLRGVHSSLSEMTASGHLYKAHDDVEHVKVIGQNLRKVFEANIIAALQDTLITNRNKLTSFSRKLHRASDEEDRAIAMKAFTPDVANALSALKSLGRKLPSNNKNHHH